MFHKNPKLVKWFRNELPYDPINVLYHGYHAPIRYELYKNFLLFEHDDAALLETEEDVKKSIRRINLLLTLERILNNIEKFEEDRQEEMILKITSMIKELNFYNCNRKMTAIENSLILIIKFQKEDGSFPVSLAGNAFIAETLLEFGLSNNLYLEKNLKWLLKQQNDDKGWGTTKDGHSDVWLTTKILHVFSYCIKYFKSTKIRKAVEFLLDHLFVENRGGIIEGKIAWEVLSKDYMFEGSFAGGVLAVLEVCARLNISVENPHISEMLNWLKSKQLQSGHWPSQTYDAFDKRSDERVTMRVVRVLKLFYLMPQGGSGTIKSFKIKQDGRTNSKKPAFITDPENNPKPELIEKNKNIDEE
ncbi:MAG: prenyltransferase/squalene oxidase repeat-containing protein [Candidatus Neomarinimicrobiota bacterium]